MAAPQSFHEMLLQARVAASQTVDAMAILLNMSPEQYEQLESGRYPDDETLRRLCKMMGWNYYEAQRLIINEMISPHPKLAPGAAKRWTPLRPSPGAAGAGAPAPRERPTVAAAPSDTLGSRLREARARMGQSKEMGAMLLNCGVEDYERYERGDPPPDEVLRRMSLVFNWNYLELMDMMRSEQAHAFQPRLAAPPFAGATALLGRLNQVAGEITTLFARLSSADQQTVLAQLELVRDTMRRHQLRPAEPAPGRAGA
jgi:transcriptional regulator with XRE-family HTH domain